MAAFGFTRRYEVVVPDSELLRIGLELLEEWGDDGDGTIGVQDIVQRCDEEGLLADEEGLLADAEETACLEADADDWSEDFYTEKQLREELE